MIQYVIFLVTTGVVLPWIDQVGRRPVFLTGSILCMSLHYAIAGTMAMYGYPVSSVNGNSNLRWRIQGHPGKAVIACSYIFTGVYGFTWVWPATLAYAALISAADPCCANVRPPRHGFMPPRCSRSNIEQTASASRRQSIGFSTLHWHTSSPRRSPIFSGKRTSSSAYSAP